MIVFVEINRQKEYNKKEKGLIVDFLIVFKQEVNVFVVSEGNVLEIMSEKFVKSNN